MNNESTMTRREFAAKTAAAGFAILTASAAQAAKKKAGKDAIKIGLIGCGGRGTGAAVNCLKANKDVLLIALADVFPDKLEACRRKISSHPAKEVKDQYAVEDDHCFVGLDAYEKLLQTDVDMIIHATPPYIRPVHIEAAVKAGKHIFTEKPIAVDAAGVRRFIAAAREAEAKKLSFVCGTQRRHQKEYLEVIQQIHDGAIGEILAGRAYWCGELPFSYERKPEWNDLEYRLRNWYNQIWTCGDNIVEQHIHNLDVINWALNAHPVKVFASGGRAWKPNTERYGDIWDHFCCDYEYPNGVHVLSMSRHWERSAGGVFEEVTGTKGVSPCRRPQQEGDPDPYEQEHVDLLASIRGTGPYLNEGVRCAESTLTAIMGRMSAYTGEVVTWDQAMNADEDLVPKELDFSKPYPLGPIPVPGRKRNA